MKVRVSEWIAQNFAAGSQPAEATVRKWIRAGKVQGVIIGGSYYVEVGDAITTGNALADRVLAEMKKAG